MQNAEISISNKVADKLISIGIIAWNEEKGIRATLESLFQQSLFQRLGERGLSCEIVCVANGCTDNTPKVAAQVFAEYSAAHEFRHTFTCRPLDVKERGKINAWNLYVHSLSASEAQFLFLMDADIKFLHPDTLWNMVDALQENETASIATDRPEKSISFKQDKSLFEKISLRVSQMTQAGDAQLCGQLYCIRSVIARRIYLPRDLGACEDGFIKWVVCTDFITKPLNPQRIIIAKDAAHVFDAYTSPSAILRNQKRQMIGQTVVHILIDDYLKTLTVPERLNLAVALREKESADPQWLQRLIGDYIQQTKHFWQLIPGLAGMRFKRIAKLKGLGKVVYLPTAIAGFAVSMIACFNAYGFLKQGSTNYWPHGKSPASNSAGGLPEGLARTASHSNSAL
ncbi:glycosyltransferase family 2 protein [Pedosphaera parvula]|uniref:Glycosyl transferase family 2 n=1 Tax=Pedosphaera parvula (strain Ellin514) TaxID=320771 RepID=B9X9S7_PEDPL|nr:glycosyltransferase [Pedosphaera parvula]EEF63228.1 glycosyl transferase family 2 [Pedosphaera parvula Ellin514]